VIRGNDRAGALALSIRPEQPEDTGAVRKVHRAAFGRGDKARLVDQLRARGKALVSLVAEVDGKVVGHILFSPVSIEGNTAFRGAGMAPLPVLPAFQRRGVGTRLTQAGLAACRAAGLPFVVVLGEPDFYRRLEFQKASARGLRNDYGVDDPFMVLELRSASLPQGGGLVEYAPEFAEVEV